MKLIIVACIWLMVGHTTTADAKNCKHPARLVFLNRKLQLPSHLNVTKDVSSLLENVQVELDKLKDEAAQVLSESTQFSKLKPSAKNTLTKRVLLKKAKRFNNHFRAIIQPLHTRIAKIKTKFGNDKAGNRDIDNMTLLEMIEGFISKLSELPKVILCLIMGCESPGEPIISGEVMYEYGDYFDE